MNKIKKNLWIILSDFNLMIEKISSLLNCVMILVVFFVCTQAIAFCFIYFQLLNAQDINMVLFKYINIWGILSTKTINNESIYLNLDDIKLRMEFLMNVAIALSGILLSIGTILSYFKKNIEEKRKSCFKKIEIYETGKDDIELMSKYFKGANYVCIYSHTFEWLNKSDGMRSLLNELSRKGKLKLCTSKDAEEVKNNLNSCTNDLLACVVNTDAMLRFSYVERDNTKYILYRQEQDEHTYIIVVRENSESQFLLQLISNVIK